MAKATNTISRRSMFSSALAAGAVLTIPAAAMAQAETVDDKDLGVARRPLEILVKALVDNRIDCKFPSLN